MKKFILLSFSVLASSLLFAVAIPNVPYFYQYNNTNNPGGSCQNTSVAMVTKYYGATGTTPDQCSNNYGTSQAQTVSGLETVFNSEAVYFNLDVRINGHDDGTFQQIKTLIDAGKPVIVHGYFTGYGHVMVIVGYTANSYICNDPAGEWSQQVSYGGYSQANATEGQYISYAKTNFENAIGPNGTIWYHEVYYINGYTGPGNVVVNPPAPPIVETIIPTTSVAASTAWKTTDFIVNFSDADLGGSNLEKSFFNVTEDYNGKWQSNGATGFVYDDFSGTLANTWTTSQGTWTNMAGKLNQTSLTNPNTNMNMLVNQNLSNRSLIHWRGKITSSGATQRVGMHYFCDDATLSNRGNSYFVWFRQATSTVEIFKVVNNVFGSPIASFSSITISNNVQYDYKVMFDRITGKHTIWLNNALIGTYTDATPHTIGNAISFRTAESAWEIDDITVYRSRQFASALVHVGNASSKEVRVCNSAPNLPASNVSSLTIDGAGNLSALANQYYNVDFTVPSQVSGVNDGISADLDTTLNTTLLAGNWTNSVDANSGIQEYVYFVGTSPGLNNIIDTMSTTVTSFNLTGLNLQIGATYYTSVFAKNNAGLFSLLALSDGIYIDSIADPINTAGISEIENNEILVYPNPFNTVLNINAQATISNAKLFNSLGMEIKLIQESTQNQFSTSQLASGVYMLQFEMNGVKVQKRIMKE